MKISKFFPVVVGLIILQCNSPEEKINKSDYSGVFPIKDLITEVPTLDEKSIVPVILEDDHLKVVFDKNSGRLVSLISKQTNWQLQRRGYLARSFRLAVPVPGGRDNCVYGERQSACNLEISNDTKKLVFTWDKLTSNCDQALNIKFSGIVELTDAGLQFSAKIENNSPYTVESVYWPYLGDLNVPKTQNLLKWMNTGSLNQSIYPWFSNHKGYEGVDYPIQVFDTRFIHFGLLGNDYEGMYTCYDDTTDKHLVNFTFELKPGFEHSRSVNFGTVPKQDSISGKPAHIEYSCVHFAYVNPQETEILKPVLFKPYLGDWQKGADLYKAWRKSWIRALPCPDWAKKVHSWQQIHVNSPEDYPRSSYKDLVVYAKECAKYGVKAIELTGWNLGGQDRGNPSHDIDPRLGTWEDLKNAIAECQKLGVHIILFSKFTWADESQPWFKNELVKYAVKDPYGQFLDLWAYQYHTAVQLAGINTRRLVPMCHLSPEWRKVADQEFIKTIDLGADGMLYDEAMHHGSVFYCFDPDHHHHVPAHVYSGDILLESEFRKIASQRAPGYLFAGETIRDLQFRSYNISYLRINRDHLTMHRYVAPESDFMMTITGYNDRYPINQALLFRYIISYEPRNFKGHLSEFPLTMEYGMKMDALREKYSDFLWNGEFVNTVGAAVKVKNGMKAVYSVFINHKLNKRAVVIANPSYDQSITADVKLENKNNGFLAVSPEKPETMENEGKIEIPALSVVVLLEK